MKTVPFWLDDFPRPADLPHSPLPEEVDVAVIGGGYTGLSAARILARGGARVAVLEQGEIGSGASGINGGQVSAGVKLSIQEVFKKYGPELGREIWEGSLQAVKFLEQTLIEEKIECDYTPSGILVTAYRPAHYKRMAHEVEWLAQKLDFHDVELIPPDKMGSVVGSNVFFGGMLEKVGGGLHPAKYVFGLAKAAVRAGVCLCEQTKVLHLDRSGRRPQFLIRTGRGELKAGKVLLATNGYTGSLAPEFQRRIFAVGSYMITTEPLPPELQQELCPHNRVMYDTKWFLNYFRLTPDGRMSMGGRNNLSPNLNLTESAHNLARTMVHIFPQLRNVAITHTWAGRLGITFNLMPYIGQMDGIYHAFGYAGHGVALSGYLGKEVAELILGQATSTPFARIPPETSVFYRGNAWFLPVVAAYYRFLDAVS